MKKLVIVLSLIFIYNSNFGQIGFSAAYKPITAKNWEHVIAQHPNFFKANPYANGIQFGVDYWFRLKNQRVEFLPEFSISRFSRIWEKEQGVNDHASSIFLGLHFNTNFYVFDFKGDCDCPTFSKDGNDIQKGFFIQVSPGVDYISNKFTDNSGELVADDIVPSIGIGAGIDFGLTNLLTITPMVKYHQYFNVEWEGLNKIFETPNQLISEDLNTNHISQIFVGVRIGLRLDADQF